MKLRRHNIECIAYVFQGGGALGAYQLGIFKALAEADYHPDWVIGTSIGAINSSIIAGNKPKDRVPKLEAFWDIVSRNLLPGFRAEDEKMREWFNFISAQTSLFFGQPGMFFPRFKNPLFEINGSADNISFYVVEPLRKTLEDLVNFDLINNGNIRFSLSAVEVLEGRPVFFDNHKQKIEVNHVLASAALPPAFPAVKIKNEYFWDGGVLSNTPVQALINDPDQVNTLCFMANLFDSFGLNPKTLDDVMKRYKDIMYSSQDRSHLTSYREILRLRREIHYLSQKISEEVQQRDPHIKKPLVEECNDRIMHFVRFLYTAPDTELSSKDFEFSKLSVNERIQTGYRDGQIALKEAPWLKPIPPDEGVRIHEICSHPTVHAPWEKKSDD